MKIINYKDELNEAQYRAVFAPDGPVLVIAGAGSGKTRTLVYRVARLVEEGVPPDGILLMTFTRKAAREMLGRVEAMLGQSCRGVAGGTFHALAYRILRSHGSLIDLKGNLSVLDRKDSSEIIGKLRKAAGLNLIRDFPDKSEFLEIQGRIINRGYDFEAGLRYFCPHLEPVFEKLARLHQAYDLYKREHGLLDYDDLLHLTLALFNSHPRVAEGLSRRFRYVLVDEYQDTNLLQAEIVRFLVKIHGNIMAVGDDSQSIYGFRGAHFKNIMDFPRLFPGAIQITLEENYRSTQPILNLANNLISFSRESYSKCLFSRFSKGSRPVCVELPYEENQSRYVVKELREFHRQGIPWRDMAVLFRAGHHSFNLEIFLQKETIPFVKFGGHRLVEGAHIKDLLSFLKILDNPRDVVAWERVLQMQEGLGPKRAQEIFSLIKTRFDWPGRLEVLQGYRRLKNRLGPLQEVLKQLTESPLSPTRALEIVWPFYQTYLPLLYEEDYQRRQKEIEEIIRVSTNYPDLEGFLGDVALEAYEETEEGPADRLTLSTVHSAKGLEWKVVFIIWIAEGRFPSTHALDSPEELEEERRLLYVAITRAKERLFLTYPRALSVGAGGWQQHELSHFISPIPEEVLARRNGNLSEPPASLAVSKEIGRVQPGRDGGLSRGTRVFHPLFGTGVIQEPPLDRKVRVLFKRYGSKVLHLDYAPLTKG